MNKRQFSLQEINVFLVALAPHMDFASYVHQYYKSGYLVYQESGEAGKVCADYMNRTVPQGDLLIGIDIWSGAAYKAQKSPFDNSFSTHFFFISNFTTFQLLQFFEKIILKESAAI